MPYAPLLTHQSLQCLDTTVQCRMGPISPGIQMAQDMMANERRRLAPPGSVDGMWAVPPTTTTESAATDRLYSYVMSVLIGLMWCGLLLFIICLVIEARY